MSPASNATPRVPIRCHSNWERTRWQPCRSSGHRTGCLPSLGARVSVRGAALPGSSILGPTQEVGSTAPTSMGHGFRCSLTQDSDGIAGAFSALHLQGCLLALGILGFPLSRQQLQAPHPTPHCPAERTERPPTLPVPQVLGPLHGHSPHRMQKEGRGAGVGGGPPVASHSPRHSSQGAGHAVGCPSCSWPPAGLLIGKGPGVGRPQGSPCRGGVGWAAGGHWLQRGSGPEGGGTSSLWGAVEGCPVGAASRRFSV